MCSLGLSQIGRMNLGKDASTFKYYTMCGLQEGFEPFAVNMNREVTMWFSKRLPTFVNVPEDHPHIEVHIDVLNYILLLFWKILGWILYTSSFFVFRLLELMGLWTHLHV